MKLENPTTFVVGPPAAGKSTIGRAVAAQLGVIFRTIDDWTLRGEPMTDAQVQQALTRLFSAVRPTNEIVEFCHHDYDELLETDLYPIFTVGRKVVVTAPLNVCKARNQLRRSPVRETYVERAWRSAQSLVNRCSTEKPSGVLVVDTSSQSVDAAIKAVTIFLTA